MKYWKSGLTLAILLLMGFGALMTPRIYLKYLEKQIRDISIEEKDIGKEYLDLNIRINLTENKIPAYVDSISYRIIIYDSIISKGFKKIGHESTKEKDLIFPARLKYHLLKDQIKKHQGLNSQVTILLDFHCHFPLLGDRNIRVKKRTEMQVPVIPEVRIVNLELVKFGLDDMEMLLSFSITNPNNIDFRLKEIDYHVKLDEYAISSGIISRDHHIRKYQSSEITFPLSVNLKHELKGLYKIIKGKKDWPYSLKADLLLKPSESRLNSITISAEKQGSLDVVQALKAAKNKENIRLK